jgi:hypothetical protein
MNNEIRKLKKLIKPKLKDGELRLYWGRDSRGEPPEVMLAYQGDSKMKQDLNLLHNAIFTKHVDPHVTPLFSKMRPSLIEELVERGYDLTTLTFSIMKLSDKQDVK